MHGMCRKGAVMRIFLVSDSVWLADRYLFSEKKIFLHDWTNYGQDGGTVSFGELMPASFLLEDRLYANLIRYSNKSVIEKIRQLEQEQKDYREYIESWVHEVKAPITGIALLCENGWKGYGGLDGERVTSARERYTGMGLYLCRKLCRKLGVGISAESWYGEGAKMMLEFPVSNYVVNSSK